MTARTLIVGGGISGLATAFFLKQHNPETPVSIIEKNPQVGGKVRSVQRDGFTVDWGANGFLSNVPDTLELAHALGLTPQAASPAAKNRYLFKHGRLRAVPTSPPAFLSSDLLSPVAKARAALEPLIGKASQHDESVHTFMQRHFGTGVANAFAQALVLGITAGDAKKLSMNALFPRLKQLELAHGSVVRGMIQSQRAAKQSGQAGSRLMSFEGGVQRLVDALENRFQNELVQGDGAVRLQKTAEGFALTLSSGRVLTGSRVVLATPAFVSAELLQELAPDAADLLRQIVYADVSVLGLGYARVDVPLALDGFGFLVPRGERVRSLGVLWSSSIFPDQAPDNQVLLRVIAGGMLDPEFALLSEQEALDVVRRDLRLSMGITAEPVFVEYVNWRQGIPQYTLGHAPRVEAILAALQQQPDLHVVGNAFHGVGVNDCVRDAKRVATEVTHSGGGA